MTTSEAIEQGELRKQAGIARAAERMALVWQTQLAFLSAISRAPDREITLDAAESDLSLKFPKGGKWRGAAIRQLASQGLISQTGYALSTRPARHRGPLATWRAADLGAIFAKIAKLRRLLAALEQPEIEQPNLF